MDNTDLKYAIKNIYHPVTLIINAFLTVFLIWLFISTLYEVPFIPLPVMLLIYIVLEGKFWIKLIEVRKKPAELRLMSQSLKIYDQEIMPHQMDKIIIMGYFFQKVGIKFVNKRFVSSLHCFRMNGDADEVIESIKEWSQRNDVKVERGHFSVWL